MSETGKALSTGWRMALTPANAAADPAALESLSDFLDAPVPGTVAGALERAGRFDRAAPEPLDHLDAWYVLDLSGEEPGDAVLHFDGLATITEIWWNGALTLSSDSMFVRHDLPVTLTGNDRLVLCFRALKPHLEKRGPRARWRPQMITPQGLRLVRTTLLGRMPGWCPEVHAAGPWRPVRLSRPKPAVPTDIRLSARLHDDGKGRLEIVSRSTVQQRQRWNAPASLPTRSRTASAVSAPALPFPMSKPGGRARMARRSCTTSP